VRPCAHAIFVADHDLEAPPAVVERPGELGHELGRLVAIAEHGEGVELAAGDVRGRVGWKRRGVDRHRKAGFLHQPRSRQAHDAGAEHGDRLALPLQPELGRELGAAPAERNPAAAMAVIVDQALVAERLGADDEALAAVRPEAGDGADQPARIGVDRRKRRATADRAGADGRAARQQRGGADRECAAIQKHPFALSLSFDTRLRQAQSLLRMSGTNKPAHAE
jgi:hypothetical protein